MSASEDFQQARDDLDKVIQCSDVRKILSAYRLLDFHRSRWLDLNEGDAGYEHRGQMRDIANKWTMDTLMDALRRRIETV